MKTLKEGFFKNMGVGIEVEKSKIRAIINDVVVYHPGECIINDDLTVSASDIYINLNEAKNLDDHTKLPFVLKDCGDIVVVGSKLKTLEGLPTDFFNTCKIIGGKFKTIDVPGMSCNIFRIANVSTLKDLTNAPKCSHLKIINCGLKTLDGCPDSSCSLTLSECTSLRDVSGLHPDVDVVYADGRAKKMLRAFRSDLIII